MKIYATGTLRFVSNEYGNELCHASRLWGLFDNFKDAEAFLIENDGDCFEGYYNYGLIEEHETNLTFSKPPKHWWYKTIVSEDVFFVVKTDCPHSIEQTFNWWVG